MKLSQLDTLAPGTRVEVEFTVVTQSTYLRALELYAIERKLNSLPQFKYLGYHEGADSITFEGEVTEPTTSQTVQTQEAGIQGLVIVGAIVGAGLFTWLSFKEIRVIGLTALAATPGGVEKVQAVTEAAKAGDLSGTLDSLVVLVVVAAGVYFLWPMIRKGVKV